MLELSYQRAALTLLPFVGSATALKYSDSDSETLRQLPHQFSDRIIEFAKAYNQFMKNRRVYAVCELAGNLLTIALLTAGVAVNVLNPSCATFFGAIYSLLAAKALWNLAMSCRIRFVCEETLPLRTQSSTSN